MAANGISTLSTKLARVIAKLQLAEAKRKGYVVARNGAISGEEDPTKNYYRPLNNYNLSSLPEAGGVDNPNVGGLKIGRPWSTDAQMEGILTEDSIFLRTEDGSNITEEI